MKACFCNKVIWGLVCLRFFFLFEGPWSTSGHCCSGRIKSSAMLLTKYEILSKLVPLFSETLSKDISLFSVFLVVCIAELASLFLPGIFSDYAFTSLSMMCYSTLFTSTFTPHAKVFYPPSTSVLWSRRRLVLPVAKLPENLKVRNRLRWGEDLFPSISKFEVLGDQWQ